VTVSVMPFIAIVGGDDLDANSLKRSAAC